MNTTEKMKEKKRKIIRSLFGLFSFSAVMFVFQACYGTPTDYGLDIYVEGVVISKKNNNPIQGIKVTLEGSSNYGISDSLGRYSFYDESAQQYSFKFQDLDTATYGAYRSLDTTIYNSDKLNKIVLNVALEEVE